MAFVKTLHLELPRRIVVYYLLFCLIAAVWLMAGMAFVARSAIHSKSENTILSQLGRESARFEIDHVRNGTKNLQSLVEQVREESELAYCAVLSPDQRFLAHSTSRLIGQQRIQPSGDREEIGDIATLRYVDENGRNIREFQVPLGDKDETFAKLLIAISEPNAVGMILSTGESLPFVILGPIGILVIGGFYLQRLVRPMADIDSQLRSIAIAPCAEKPPIREVRIAGPGSLGWNRLVGEMDAGPHRPDLEERIGAAIESRSQNKLGHMLNALPEGLAATDTDGVILFANQAFLAFVGHTQQDELPAQAHVEGLFDLQQVSPDDSLLDETLTARHVVTEIVREDVAGDRNVRLARHPIRSPDSESFSGHVWSVRDITQQKLSDKMRDEFLDSAAHELRTPLANIKAYAETLAITDMLEVEQQKEFCNTINSEATRLARLIDDLLNVSSLEAGSLSIVRKKVEIDRLLRDVAAKVQAQMDQRDITFETQLSKKLPELHVDKDKIMTTLVNLLGNAAKYTPQGGRVAMKARVVDTNLEVVIEDSGIGISKDELPKVFGKFFRSDDDRVRAITGTGLGLALAHEIVRLHGGTLTAQSELNKGSTFTLTLPTE